MALALDGSAHTANGSTNSFTVDLSTTNANDVIILIAESNGCPITSVTSASLAWNFKGTGGSGSNSIELWYAIASAALTTETITVNSTTTAFMSLSAFGISGADTVTIFDGAVVTGGGDPLSISTTAADTFILGGYREFSEPNPTAGTGFTQIHGGADYLLTEYKIVSAAQTSLSITQGTGAGNANGGVAIAVLQGGGAVVVSPSLLDNRIARFKTDRFSLLSSLRHNVAADFSTAQVQPATNIHFIGKYRPDQFRLLPGLMRNPTIVTPVQAETNTHFIGRFSPTRFALLPQLLRAEPQDSSAPQVAPATNVHFLGKFQPTRFTLLPGLRHGIALESIAFVAETNTHFVGKFAPSRLKLLPALNFNIAADTSTATVQPETNPHFIGKFKPDNFSLLRSSRFNVRGEDTAQPPQLDAVSGSIVRFQPTVFNRLQNLNFSLAADTTSQPVQPTTDPHFLGKFTPTRLNRLIGLSFNIAADTSTAQTQPETNTHFIGKFQPNQIRLLPGLRQNQDIITPPAVQADTNVHFVGKFAPTQLKLLRSLGFNVAADTSAAPVQPATNIHFLGKFKPTTLKLMPSLAWNPSHSSGVVVQPSTSFHHHPRPRFQPTKLQLLTLLRQESLFQPSAVVHFCPDVTGSQVLYTITGGTSTFAARGAMTVYPVCPQGPMPPLPSIPPIIVPPAADETNVHFVGRFAPMQLRLLRSLRFNVAADTSVAAAQPATNTHFLGKFTPSRFKLMPSLNFNIAADPSGDTVTGLKSYWLMNDGSGTTFVDSISGHNGTLTSAGLWNASGWIDFDGVQFGTVADTADFNVGGTVTWFVWIKGAGQQNKGFISQYDSDTGDNRGFLLGTINTGSFDKMRVFLSDDGTSISGHLKNYEASQVSLDGTWHSFAWRFNLGVLDLFLDGVKDPAPNKTIDDAITTIFNSTDAIGFGAVNNGGTFPFGQATVAMKKARFYNIAKSDADIAAIHALGQ